MYDECESAMHVLVLLGMLSDAAVWFIFGGLAVLGVAFTGGSGRTPLPPSAQIVAVSTS